MSFVSQYPGTCAACGKRYRPGETIARGNGAREYVHEGCAQSLPPMTPPPAFKPSRYQQAVYDWMKDGEGHAVVEAVAGSGKTVTVVQALSYTRPTDRVGFIAFNKHIADELRRKSPPHVTVCTLHSMGYAALRRALGNAGCRVDDEKVPTIMDGFPALEVPEFGHPDRPKVLALRIHAAKLVSLLKATLADASSESALRGLAWRYGLDLNGDEDLIFSLVPSILARCREVTSLIDFDDMCWLPVALDLPVEQFDWVFGDEAQDWNPTQIALALRAVAPGGRCVAVGDRRQSIYGFRGADTEAIPNLISALGAITLPLSICYRCPASHVALAHEIVPQIEARPDAPEGEVLTIKEDKFSPVSGDMVICRTNAPLVGPAMALSADGKKAVIRGRDIGKSLAVLARKVFEKAATLPEALNKLERYADRERSRLVAKGAPETQLEALDDRVNTISQIAASCDSPAAVPTRIEEIFSDDVAGVVFSSVHRAKGLEADTVYILRPDLIPLRRKRQQDWEATQEHNLHYVALTRAKKTLVFVEHKVTER